LILRPAAKPPSKPDPVARLRAILEDPSPALPRLLVDPPPPELSDPTGSLFPTLYHLLPMSAILDVLDLTGTRSQRQRKLPAHEVVWLVIAQSWFANRSLPMVWRHIRPSPMPGDAPLPVDSSFTEARQRLGAVPLKLLFHRTCRPMATPLTPGAYHNGFLLVALDGSVLETPDTPLNRRVFGSACNQYGAGAFPQLRLAAICEVATHAVTDVEMGPYNASELDLSLRLLRRLPSGRLVLMDRGLSYYKQVEVVRKRHSHVLARVKAGQRDLPVEKVLPDGSYLSTIYPSSNAKRSKRGGIRVRVIRYTHDDASRDGCGEESCLISTVLCVTVLSAKEALRLYPFRWEEESVFLEIKETMLLGSVEQTDCPAHKRRTKEAMTQKAT
jgi:Insertion element 4 transposase N-terminal/Transposase DDE domain